MSRMFGMRLEQFVMSTDIMDQETFHALLELVQDYVSQQLNVDYFSVLEACTINNDAGLRTIWTTRDEQPSFTVKDQDGNYQSQSGYTFDKNRPIWVVNPEKKSLHADVACEDLWHGAEDLPPYALTSDREVKSSVMHPLRRDGMPIGVIEFATRRYVEPTPASLEEATTLASTIQRAYRMYDVRKWQRDNTERVIDLLKDALENESWTRLALPHVFVAFPSAEGLADDAERDHEEVIGAIREVFDGFNDLVDPVFWDDATESGNITAQIVESISQSELGVCYFSKPNDEGGYRDSANVLYESGMMQALTNSGGASMRGWIPIRERASPEVPFDISTERLLLVPRDDAGAFAKEEFIDELRDRISTLVKDLT